MFTLPIQQTRPKLQNQLRFGHEPDSIPGGLPAVFSLLISAAL